MRIKSLNTISICIDNLKYSDDNYFFMIEIFIKSLKYTKNK